MARPQPRIYGPATVRQDGSIALPAELRRDIQIGEGAQIRFFVWEGERRLLVLIDDERAEATARYFIEGLEFKPPRKQTK
jgi:bifunctional DNA-binding transcriptional regulator/antitoxin component of YhaV-PrlF toxin-antitoxin module